MFCVASVFRYIIFYIALNLKNKMDLQEIKIIKSDERGIIYNCGKSSFITRRKGTISANHTHEDNEIVYLVRGEVELTIGDETQIVKAPIMFETAPNVYHKLVALTDIDLVIDRS
jgi:mannose-6-phosphate isomerase-like protein (cupin superfamily)